jgi:hypothetical protein
MFRKGTQLQVLQLLLTLLATTAQQGAPDDDPLQRLVLQNFYLSTGGRNWLSGLRNLPVVGNEVPWLTETESYCR